MKVLLIEDEPKVTRALKRMLTDIVPGNLEFAEADNGIDGLRLAVEAKPDLLMLDMMMPGLNGDEVFRRIREELELEIPVIVVSGHHDFALVRQALANDAIDYILKPFDKEEVAAALAKAQERMEKAKLRDRSARIVTDMRTEQFRMRRQSALKNLAIGRLDRRDLELLPPFVREGGCRLHLLVLRNYEQALYDRFHKDIALLDYAIRKCVDEYAEQEGLELLAGGSGQYEWSRWLAVKGGSQEESGFRPQVLENTLRAVLKLDCSVLSSGKARQVAQFAEGIAELESRALYVSLTDGPSPALALPPEQPQPIRSPELAQAIVLFTDRVEHLIRHRLLFRIGDDIDELFDSAAKRGQLSAMYAFQAWMSMHDRLEANPAAGGAGAEKTLDRAEPFALHIAFRADYAKRLFKAAIEAALDKAERGREERKSGSRALAVKEYIDIAYRDSLSLAALAARFYISKEYLAARFKSEFGLTVTQYVHDVRLEAARPLLRDATATVSAVALAVGYDHFSYFDKRFRAKYGVTPTEYRNMSKNDER